MIRVLGYYMLLLMLVSTPLGRLYLVPPVSPFVAMDRFVLVDTHHFHDPLSSSSSSTCNYLLGSFQVKAIGRRVRISPVLLLTW